MKKFLLTFICSILAAVGAMAQSTYTDYINVMVDGEYITPPIQANVLFTDNGDGTCNFSLPNFMLGEGDEAMPVGNININNITLTKGDNGIDSFKYHGPVTITAGDDPNYAEDDWFGPALSEENPLDIDLFGKVSADKIYVVIDIDLTEMLGQMVHVTFGDPNFNAVEYTDNLVVTINDESSAPQQTTVIFNDNGDGTCNFMLPNFVLGEGEDALPVGNIDIQNIPLSDPVDGIRTFNFKGTITVGPGNDPTKEFWYGPELGELPLELNGKVANSKIYVSIKLDLMEILEQVIDVTFGDDDFSKVVGINNVDTLSAAAALYDLQGRRVRNAQQGVAISAGRKMIRK